MGLTVEQKATSEYKKGLRVSDTKTEKAFYEEMKGGRVTLGSTIWTSDHLIPETAPTGLGNGETSGVVQRIIDLELSSIAGSPDSFYHVDLKDAIPFNWGTGYLYTIKNNLGVTLSAGYGDVAVDAASGVLRFYSGSGDNMPPSISFFKYIGPKGIVGDSGILNEVRGTVLSGETQEFTIGDIRLVKILRVMYSAERSPGNVETGVLSLTNYNDTKIGRESELDEQGLLIEKKITGNNIIVSIKDLSDTGDLSVILTMIKQSI